jgi:hypothetical protein
MTVRISISFTLIRAIEARINHRLSIDRLRFGARSKLGDTGRRVLYFGCDDGVCLRDVLTNDAPLFNYRMV